MIFVQKIKIVTIVALVSILLINNSTHAAMLNDPTNNVLQPVVYQLQTGSNTSASSEYISVFNNSADPVDVTNWSLEYVTVSGSSKTTLGVFKSSDVSRRIMLNGYGYIAVGTKDFQQSNPDTSLSFIFTAGLSGAGGHIQLVNASKTAIDTIGYGAAISPETLSVAAHPNSKILQRKVSTDQILQDTNNNNIDFTHTDPVYMNTSLYEKVVDVSDEISPVIITELLPNPSGSDFGLEFIEFYNSADEPISLGGYVVQLGPAYTKTVALPDIVINPGSYISLSDTQTGLVLPNTSASLKLVSPSGIQAGLVPSYSDPPDEVSWALDGDEWKLTYTPTPGSANTIQSYKSCSESYMYSEVTGNCQKVSPVTNAIMCPIGQERNPETGRCRKATTQPVVASCAAGKIRNIQTGRCGNPDQVGVKKGCPEGQERNPDSGRCKKVITKASAIPEVKDVDAPVVENNAKWWAAGLAGTGSAGYAAYEWRQDLRRRFELLKISIGKLFNK